tara:strand:+ start:487 stop:909 length:423 start_codon:yes stop_codon:yes gene_type:complete
MKNSQNIVNYEKVIEIDNGDVLHGMKNDSIGYVEFGEMYFSEIKFNSIKAWKRHTSITSNILVPIGEVKFVLVIEEDNNLEFKEFIISKKNYLRLTIPPLVWYGFKGVSHDKSLIVSLIDKKHDPNESESTELEGFNYEW